MERLGTVDRRYPAYFVANPPHPPDSWDVMGYGNGDQTIWPYRLPTWLHGQRTKERLLVSFDSSVTVLRSNREWSDFARIWIGIGQGYPKPNTQRGASGRYKTSTKNGNLYNNAKLALSRRSVFCLVYIRKSHLNFLFLKEWWRFSQCFLPDRAVR